MPFGHGLGHPSVAEDFRPLRQAQSMRQAMHNFLRQTRETEGPGQGLLRQVRAG